jgi:hypothetical protein
MSEPVPGGPTVIEGQIGRKLSNALTIVFRDGPGDPIATGVQGAGDSALGKLGMLFGFRNGGTGNHVVTYRDGAALRIASRDMAPTVLTRLDGTQIATVHRGPTSTAVLAGGETLFHFAADPAGATTLELFRLLVRDVTGAEIGRLDVIRRSGGWTIARALDAASGEYVWWGHAGRSLPIPVLGTRLALHQPVQGIPRDVLLGACVDLAIGLRPYVAEMS